MWFYSKKYLICKGRYIFDTKQKILLSDDKRIFSWCGRWDLNPYGCPHAPQTCASASSATAANIKERVALT